MFVVKRPSEISELKEIFATYKKLSITDRIVSYTLLSNKVNIHENNLQDFIIKSRIIEGNVCIHKEYIILLFVLI